MNARRPVPEALLGAVAALLLAAALARAAPDPADRLSPADAARVEVVALEDDAAPRDGVLLAGVAPPAAAPPRDAEAAALAALTPDDAAIVEAGNALLERGAPLAAALHFRAVPKASPASPVARYNEGVALHAAGELTLAERRFRDVVALPEQPELVRLASHNLGRTIFDRAEGERGPRLAELDPLERLLDGDPEAAWERYAAAVDDLLARYDEAARQFRTAYEADPSDAEAAQGIVAARRAMRELQRERDDRRRRFEDLLAQLVQPQDALREMMEIADAQRRLADRTESAAGEPQPQRGEQAERLAGEQRQLAEQSERLYNRLQNTVELAAEQGATTDPTITQLLSSVLEDAAGVMADAVDAQQWAEFELRDDRLSEAEDLQRQAAGDVQAVLDGLMQRAEQLQEMLGQMQQEQQSAGEDEQTPETPPQDGGDPQQDQMAGGAREGVPTGADEAERILAQEREDRERAQRGARRRSGAVERDW